MEKGCECIPNFSNKLFYKAGGKKSDLGKTATSCNIKEGRHGLMLLIKPGNEAVYSNVINILDKALINDVKKYTVLKPDEEK